MYKQTPFLLSNALDEDTKIAMKLEEDKQEENKEHELQQNEVDKELFENAHAWSIDLLSLMANLRT